jgi:aspartyl-tRNA(Asn)/glutamyl-tRNA(Gln) amidotransferase subunit A
VTRIAIPALDTIAEAMAGGTIAAAEAYAWHRPFLERGRQGDYDPRVLARILAGGAIDAAGLKRLHRWRRGLIAEIAAAAAPFDALVWPTAPILAPTFATLADDEDYARINALVLRNSTAANLFDGCAISLPCPDAAAPVGLTLAAPGGHDDALLVTAAGIETMLQR